MIKAGIIGATGYAGAELARILLSHPEAEVVWYGSRSYTDQAFSSQFGSFFRIIDTPCSDDDIERLAGEVDVIFTATPQGFCASVISNEILEQAKLIDLSADFRLKDVATYEQWYQIKHAAPSFIEEAVYGLCEINRDSIKEARLVANPGCYTSCSILALYPLVAAGLVDADSIIIDAKSGTSGAGRGAKVANLFCEVNENIKAYGVATHRHTPEIEEQLSYAAGRAITLSFTPHLVPMERGILVTAYAALAGELSSVAKDADAGAKIRSRIDAAYEKYYADEPFIRLLPDGRPAETRWVAGSNYVDISYALDPRTGRVIVMAALDNLVKGAAGQAVQNMNLMFGLPETTGLAMAPMFP